MSFTTSVIICSILRRFGPLERPLAILFILIKKRIKLSAHGTKYLKKE